jgi:hypothetical protein
LDLLETGEIGLEGGFFPKSYNTLVQSSSIIVKGRFGDLLSNESFYRFDDSVPARKVTREESKEKWSDTEDEVENWALPISSYEVLVDQVLLGNVDSDAIILTMIESTPTNRILTHSDKDRILFLVENPDGTYVAREPTGILMYEDGFYGWEEIDFRTWQITKHVYDFADSMVASEFETKLSTEIEKRLSESMN